MATRSLHGRVYCCGTRRKCWPDSGLIVALAGLLVLLAPYALPAAAPAPASRTTSGPSKKPPSPNFDREWAKLAAAARQEGKLILNFGRTGERDLKPVIDTFAKEFGIKVIVGRGGGSEQTERWIAERAGGVYQMDVASPGLSSLRGQALPAKALTPLKPLLFHPEVTDLSLWNGGRHWYADPEEKYLFIYGAEAGGTRLLVNTNLVKPNELQSYWDLMNPKWKGKIVAYHPITGATGVEGSFAEIYYTKSVGPEFLRRIYTEKRMVLVATDREFLDGLASGAYAIGFLFGPLGRDVDQMQKQGLPVARYSTPGKGIEVEVPRVSIPGSLLAAADRPANPNAQKLFVNWWLTRQAQLSIVQQRRNQSLRMDVPIDLVPENWRLPDPLYIFDADPGAAKKQVIATKFVRDLVEKFGL